MRSFFCAAIAVILATSAASAASTMPDEFRPCLDEAEDDVRLQCFDEVVREIFWRYRAPRTPITKPVLDILTQFESLQGHTVEVTGVIDILNPQRAVFGGDRMAIHRILVDVSAVDPDVKRPLFTCRFCRVTIVGTVTRVMGTEGIRVDTIRAP